MTSQFAYKTCFNQINTKYLRLITQSDSSKCYLFDQVKTSYSFEDMTYFLRKESLNFGPVVLSNCEEGRNINIGSDSDAFIIIGEVNTENVVDIKDFKSEITSTSMDTDFLMDQLGNGNEQN